MYLENFSISLQRVTQITRSKDTKKGQQIRILTIKIRIMQNFQKSIHPLEAKESLEGKLGLEEYNVDLLKKSITDIIKHAKSALSEMDKETPSTTRICICYEGIFDSLEDFERHFFRYNSSLVQSHLNRVDLAI